MKVLITGGSGFIGSHLVDRLLLNKDEVIIVDRNIKWKNLPKNKPQNLSVYHNNLSDNIVDLFKDVDIVYHLAALTRPQWSIKYPYETTKINVLDMVKILEYSRDNNIKRFIFLSSSDLYGDQPVSYFPTFEGVTPNPMNSYALSKYIGELYCQLFNKLYGLEYNIIRPFNAYGTRMPVSGYYTSAVATFIDALKNDKPFITFGTGEQRRDFIYIDDIVDMLILLATSEVKNETFNCGFGKNYSINQVRETIEKIMNKKIDFNRIKGQFEKKETLADIHKAQLLLNWNPKVDLEEGLKKTIDNYE